MRLNPEIDQWDGWFWAHEPRLKTGKRMPRQKQPEKKTNSNWLWLRWITRKISLDQKTKKSSAMQNAKRRGTPHMAPSSCCIASLRKVAYDGRLHRIPKFAGWFSDREKPYFLMHDETWGSPMTQETSFFSCLVPSDCGKYWMSLQKNGRSLTWFWPNMFYQIWN